jgi:type I restriction enzyme S subunit
MRLPQYPCHKDSGVEWLGEIPAHWEVSPLFGLAAERNETNRGMVEDNLLSLSYGRIVQKDIASNDGLLPESFETYQIVHHGDIVFRLTDLQNDKRSLRTAIVEQQGIITSAYLAVVPLRIQPRFFHYLLRAYDVTKVFYSMGGGLRQSMNFWDVKRLPILAPPPEEQLGIAAFLDSETVKIDALVAKMQCLVELLKEKRQAVISNAVTKGLDPHAPVKDSRIEWLGEVPAHWAVAAIGYRYEVQLGKMLDSARITGDHLRPYLRVADVQWGKINTDDLPEMDFDEESRRKFVLRWGDLLVNEGGSYPGRSAIWSSEIECYYQKALHRVRPLSPTSDTSRFFYYVLMWAANYGVFVAGGSETTIEHLPAEKLRKYRFAFPDFNEQVGIASYLDCVSDEINQLVQKAERDIAYLQERRIALISAAVTGRIDVRGLTSTEAA